MRIDQNNRRIDIDIVFYLFNNPNKTNTEITEEMRRLGHKRPTIQTHIVKLRKARYIIRREDKLYKINPYIKDPDKDMSQQINYGILSDRVEQSKLNYTTYLEIELYRRLTSITSFDYKYVFKPEKDFQKIRFSNATISLLGKLLYSLIRNVFILNRDTWFLTKDVIYDFFVGFYGEWSNDPMIFEIIKKLRKQYYDLGYIPINNESPFTLPLSNTLDLVRQDEEREINLKIKDFKQKIDKKKTNEQVYKNAIYEETLRDETRERIKQGKLKEGEILMKFQTEEEFKQMIRDYEKELGEFKREIRIDDLKPIYLNLIDEELDRNKDDLKKLSLLQDLKVSIEKENHPFTLIKNLKIKWFDGKPQITETRVFDTIDLLKGKITELPLPKSDKR